MCSFFDVVVKNEKQISLCGWLPAITNLIRLFKQIKAL